MFEGLSRSLRHFALVLKRRQAHHRAAAGIDDVQPLLAQARALAQGIVSGTIPAEAAVHTLHQGPVLRLGHPFALQDWCDLDQGLYQDPRTLRLVPAEGAFKVAAAVAAAQRLLAREADDLAAELRGHLVRGSQLRAGWGRRLGGTALGLLAVMLPLGVVAFMAASIAAGRFPPGSLIVGLLLVMGGVLWGLAWMLNEGSATIIDSDGGTGRTVLLLRPFGEDRAQGESDLVAALGEWGEVSAIGQPGQHIPPLGARRVYLEPEGDGWQALAARLMQSSDLVALRAGSPVQAGFRWEIAYLLANEHPSRIVLVLPRDPLRYAGFRSATRDLFPHALPAPRSPAQRQDARAASAGGEAVVPVLEERTAFLVFDEAWRPVQLPLPRWQPLRASLWRRYEVALAAHLSQVKPPAVPPPRAMGSMTEAGAVVQAPP